MPDIALDRGEGRRRLLDRVADALGIPSSTFYGPAPGDDHNAVRLLSLWMAITNDPGRRRIMAAALNEARQCGYVEPDDLHRPPGIQT